MFAHGITLELAASICGHTLKPVNTFSLLWTCKCAVRRTLLPSARLSLPAALPAVAAKKARWVACPRRFGKAAVGFVWREGS